MPSTLPFTAAQFLDVFARYNDAVWPAQWVLNGIGVAAFLLALRGGPRAGRAASALLAVLWTWTALAYHGAFFAAINPAAYGFAAACLAAAALFAWQGVARGRLAFGPPRPRAARWVAAAFAIVALVVYPLAGLAAGHRYPAFATFGLPCPTTILTLGVLQLAASRPPVAVFVVPILWSLAGAFAAFRLGMREDLLLLAAGLVSLALLSRRYRHRSPVARRVAPASAMRNPMP